MFKDFFYLLFAVDIEGKKTRYFINYKNAQKYFNNNNNKSRNYKGFHLLWGWQMFCIVNMYKQRFPSLSLSEEMALCSKHYQAEAKL